MYLIIIQKKKVHKIDRENTKAATACPIAILALAFCPSNCWYTRYNSPKNGW